MIASRWKTDWCRDKGQARGEMKMRLHYSEEDKATIRRLLALYRQERGYTQASLAREVGCGRSHIKRMEDVKNWHGPSSLQAIRLHRVLRFGDVVDERPT